MVLKIIEATQAKPGSMILIDGEPYNIRSNDISKTGKHGHAKCRIEAVNPITKGKKVLAVPGHERFDVPLVEKKKAQVLSTQGSTANVMDLESFETFDINIPEDLKDKVKEGVNVMYWVVLEDKIIKQLAGD